MIASICEIIQRHNTNRGPAISLEFPSTSLPSVQRGNYWAGLEEKAIKMM
jgi:hypothetical protein